ncbi:hypothetical protein HPB47_023735 [Ixodes persulcatus]|uniref:Uncharacterized protein n=1 Tax=Ixodes persulcatus TaxID=34615 RepID=A0AC60Q6H1_IXOPE|nr:hypothetical protein HPB47_023735 [Ixodes persulcatus]
MADPRIPSNQKDRRFHGKAITEAEGRGGDESVTPLRPKFRPWKKSVTRPAVPLWEEVTPDDRETQFYSCRDVLTPELGIGADSEPQTETWSPLSLLPPMPQKRVHERNEVLRFIRSDWFYTEDMALIPKFQNLACPNLMLIGGISFQHPTEYLNGAAVLLYHPVKEAWFFYGSTPEPRCYHTAVLVGNAVIVSGGFDPLRVGTNGEMRPSSKVFLLDLAYHSWRTLANMRHDRAYHAAVGWHDRMVVFGGMDHTGRTLSSCEVYYRKPNQWAIIHPMPLPLMGMGATTLNGRVWVLGGLTRTRHGVSLRDSVYVFDPKTDSWQEEVPLLQPRAFCTAATVLWDVWVVGGILDLHSLQCTSRIDVLDVAGGLWERRADLPAPKHSVQIAKAGHKFSVLRNRDAFTVAAKRTVGKPCDPCLPVILLFGGLDPRNPLDTGSAVLQYHPFKDRWMLVNVMPEQRNYHAAAHVDGTVFVTGIPINGQDVEGISGLHVAAANGHISLAELLLEEGANIDVANNCGWTPLMHAAQHGQVSMVSLLIRHNANINATNVLGAGALTLAAGGGHHSTVRLLLEAGADIAVGRFHHTFDPMPLTAAATNGHASIILLLLQKGCPVNQAYPTTGTTALMLCAASGHLQAAQALIEHGADPDLKDMCGKTALDIAVACTKMEVAEFLRTKTQVAHSPAQLSKMATP